MQNPVFDLEQAKIVLAQTAQSLQRIDAIDAAFLEGHIPLKASLEATLLELEYSLQNIALEQFHPTLRVRINATCISLREALLSVQCTPQVKQ